MPQRYELIPCHECGIVRKVNILKGKPVSKICIKCHCKNLARESRLHPEWRPGNPNWVRKESKELVEYRRVKLASNDPFYPMANNRGYVREHRLVMARHLGRCLEIWEVVHHKQGKTNNHLENLELETIAGHSRITAMQAKIDRLIRENNSLKKEIEKLNKNNAGVPNKNIGRQVSVVSRESCGA